MSKETKEKRPDWLSDINDKSVKASLDAGIILPRLKPRLNQVYEVEFTSDIKSFKSEYGITYNVDILHDGMNMNLIIPKSFRFQLFVSMNRKGIKTFKELTGKTIIFQLTKGDTKLYKNVDLYSCQIK